MSGRVLSVYSTKGGVGKTLLAVNLAADMAIQAQARVLLVDFATSLSADCSALLGMEGPKTFRDVLPFVSDVDLDLLRGFLPAHPSGIEILSVAHAPQQLKALKPEEIVRVLSAMARVYEYIVIDAGGPFGDDIVTVLDLSHLILLVTTADVLSVNQTRQAIEQLRNLHFPGNQLQIVVNQAGLKDDLDLGTISSSLGKKVFAQFPYEPEAAFGSIKRANPVVLSYPRSALSTRIDRLAVHFISRKHGGKGFLDTLPVRRALTEGRPSTNLDMRPELETQFSDAAERDAYIQRVKDMKVQVHQRLLERLDLKKINLEKLEGADPAQRDEMRQRTQRAISDLVDELGAFIRSREERKRVVQELLDEALGLGPLENLLSDERISEIMVNRHDRIYIERHGRIELTDCAFADNRQLLGVIERIVAPLGRRIDESTPFVDARLPDGSRVNAIIPPLAIQGPTITIRKFASKPFTVHDLIKIDAMTEEMARFLDACVKGRRNILISGGTSTGKTTMLNVMASFIPGTERIITIEDAAELQLPQDHVVRLEARPANIEGGGAITIRDLVRNALRMRPDRIVVGECRGGESLDMLQAMNTGHDGSLTTIHANSPRDSLSRLETTVLFAGFDIPSLAIRQQIAAAINVVLQMGRSSSDGSRRVLKVTEIVTLRGSEFVTQDLFVFRQVRVGSGGKVHGRFLPTGVMPTFLWDLHSRGIDLDAEIFRLASEEDRELLKDDADIDVLTVQPPGAINIATGSAQPPARG
ncbi:MAG: Flp pilus assembly complex ATPase component TadA [Candidatus Schekmanbacteria bacterium]|nr:Flp pilus assembly complex ATPase component TadA [Candidatus Schekmanbacteria bacterium]